MLTSSMSDQPELSAGGQPIYRHEDKEREDAPVAYVSEAGYAALEAHYAKFLGGECTVGHELISELVHIDVYHYSPIPERPYNVLATIGMSALPMNAPEGAEDARFAELVIALPATWPLSQESFEDENHYWPVRWLKQLARLPFEYDTWLSWGHTIPNGDPAEPLASNTRLSGVVLLPPMNLGDGFPQVAMPDGSSVNIYALIPLYDEEMDLKLREGVEALFAGFDQHGVTELLEVNRPNTVKPAVKKSLLNRLFKK